MTYKIIPQSDLKVSSICLGGGRIGSAIDEPSSFKLMDYFYGEGGNFIDTAHVYANWLPIEKSISEKTIGKWIKVRGLRNQVILATKGAHPELATMDIPRLSRREIVHDLDESLKYLQTDVIDLYWLHRDDPDRTVAEILETLNDQRQKGKIRWFGCSNWEPGRIRQAMEYAARKKWRCFVGNQMMWSLAAPDRNALPDQTQAVMDAPTYAFHRETGLAAIPYSPQANGFFSVLDEVGPERLGEGIRRKYYSDANRGRFQRAKELSRQLNRSVSAVVLAYLINQPFPTIPIAGSGTIDHLRESLSAVDLKLDMAAIQYLENGRDRL